MLKNSIVIARGDGVGPEIMQVALDVMQAAGAKLIIHEIEIGEKVYRRGYETGIEPESWKLIQNAKALLKAPVTTPQGGGFRSLNVTLRTALGLYANVRPCVAYHPFIDTRHPTMDVVIIRENEEDLYTGIEYRQTAMTVHADKIITEDGSERIIRYAFEYALRHGRKKVTCFTKDNILKMSDGLFHKVFQCIGEEYTSIEKEHWIVDIGAAKLADAPEQFDVLVMPNLYGDILSDVAAEIAGSVGLAGSANIGVASAMFEAIHGSAPRRAGQNLANPSGLLMASIMMLEHIGESAVAEKIYNGWLTTIENGIHTYDIFTEGKSQKKVGTKEFGEAVIANLGNKPQVLKPRHPTAKESLPKQITPRASETKALVGVDIFVEHRGTYDQLKERADQMQLNMPLTMVSNRGSVLYPTCMNQTTLQGNLSDEWRLRFRSESPTADQLLDLQRHISRSFSISRAEWLYTFDGKPGFTLSSESSAS